MSITPDVRKAEMYAAVIHGGQLYANEVPYTYHLELTVNVLKRFGFFEPHMIAAAWLHDSMEDRGVSYSDISKRFGELVADLVYSVTNELGKNRKERADKTYPKIRGSEIATGLKLADRIANVEYSSANGGKQDMYIKEYASFCEALRVVTADERVNRMWGHLDLLLGGNNKR